MCCEALGDHPVALLARVVVAGATGLKVGRHDGAGREDVARAAARKGALPVALVDAHRLDKLAELDGPAVETTHTRTRARAHTRTHAHTHTHTHTRTHAHARAIMHHSPSMRSGASVYKGRVGAGAIACVSSRM